jgi:tetratricopeptide (TPR) repeat protein
VGAWLARHASSEEWADLLLETARHPGVPSEILTTAWMATQNFPRPELSAFWKARGELARRLEKTEEWREQLAAEWRSGEGPLWAAEMLLQLPPEELTPALRLQILGQFLAREPSHAALAGLADWLEKNDNFASALPVRREHLRRFPQDGEARLRLARLEWLCGQAADARLTLEPWTRTAELFPELLPTLLETALARDNWPEVRFWAERGLRFGLPQEQRRFLVAKATACARLGDWESARELFAEACALPGSPSPAPLLDLWLDQNPTLLEELRPLLRPQDDFLFATLRARRLAAEARWGELALWFSHNPSLAHHPGLAPLRNRLEEIARSAPPEEPDASNPSLEAGRR